MILDVASAHPDRLAVDDFTRQRTFAELIDRATRIARALREDEGVAPGEHVALLMDNRVEYVELLLGSIFAGVWLTPINWHLAADEVAYVLQDSGARLVFTDDRFVELTREACAAGGTGAKVVEVGDPLEAMIARASDEPMPLDGPAGSNMIYTSGTTGRPKGVRRAKPDTLAAALQGHADYGNNVGLDGTGPHLVTGPMYHAAPLMFAMYDQANGAPILVMPRWDEEEALRILAERRVAHAHLVPTMFIRLLRLPQETRDAFAAPDLTMVLHGAAPVSVAVKERMIEWWGDKLVEYWGATEGGVNTLVGSADWRAHPGTVGRALAGFEIFAVDDEGERLPPGEVGQLYCRHATIARPFEYHGDEEKTASAYLAPHVFTIGDVGHVDDEGWVHLSDRKSNMIISGGVNIYPLEIEQTIQEHEAVADVAVFGIPDDEWGESVKAAVELSPGFEASKALEADILAFARERIARYKVPRSIDFERALPRHESGKLYTRRLKERYWQGRDRRI